MPDPAPESANHKIVDGVVTHSVNILRVAADERKGVLAALTALEGELLGKIQAGGMTTWSLARANALLVQTQGTIASAYAEIKASNQKTLSKVATIEATKTTNIVNGALQIPIATVGHTPEQLAKIGGNTMVNGKFPSEWWDDQEASLKGRFAAQLRMGALNGEGIDDVVRRVRGTKAKAYTDGIMAVSKGQATALVRTGIQTVANEARLETMRKNQDVIKGVVWVATLDGRTTPICRALDGLQWTFPDMKPVGHDKAFPGAIAHWQCRSTQAPVTRSWAELADNPNAKLDPVDLQAAMQKKLEAQGMSAADAAQWVVNTRASMDGQVAGALKFDDWLKTKSTDFQNKILGTGKAALWREGKIDMADMTDVDNRPLSLAQLHALVSSNLDVPAIAEGEEGLSLAERKLLQNSMAAGVETGDVLTHYVDGETGEHFVLVGTAPTEAEAAKIGAVKNLVVIQNSNTQGTVWSPQQFRYFGSLPNFRKALLVGPNGRVLGAAVKPGKVFDDAAAKDVLAKFEQMKAVKTIPHTQHKFQSALAQNGTLKFSLTPADTITLPPKTYNQVFVAAEKPLPFFDAEKVQAQQAAAKAASQALEAKTAKAAQEKIAADAITAKADLEIDARAAEVLASSNATQARATAYKASLAADKAKAAADAAKAHTEAANAAAQAEIGELLTNPKGKTLQAKALAKLMVSDPGMAPHEMLAKAKADAVIAQSKASQAAALSGYKAKVLGGLPPTPAQLKAFKALTVDEQTAFENAMAAAKLAKDTQDAEALAAQLQMSATSAKAVADALPAAALPPVSGKAIPIPHDFPDDPENLTVVKGLGGSTGAELVKDAKGGLWVRKRGNSPAHLREEVIADQLYRANNVLTPDSRLYDRPSGPVKLSRFQEGQPLNAYLAKATAAQKAAVLAEIQKGFAVDAMVANWDVLGLGLDNILIDAEGKPWRIDNGGSLRFRAQGQPKGKDWNEFTPELWTMRGKYFTPQLQALADAIPAGIQKHFADHFGSLSMFDLARQIEALDPAALAFAPDDLRTTLERRLGTLKTLGTRALDFEHSNWTAGFTDRMTRASMEMRERGIVARMVPSFQVAPGTTLMKDANGRVGDELRSRGGPAAVAAGGHTDPFGQTFLNAVVSINSHKKNGKPTFGNPVKVESIKLVIPELKKLAAGTDAAKAALGKHYLSWADAIIDAEKDFAEGKFATLKGDPLLPFDIGAGVKQMIKAGPIVAPIKPGGSITQDVVAYLKSIGGSDQAISAWMGSQAGSSWDYQAQPMKYFVATEKTTDPDAAFWWGAGKLKGAKQQFDAMAAVTGGEKALRDSFTTWIAYSQDILTTTAMPNSDSKRRALRLLRTEEPDVLKQNGIKLGEYGGVHMMKKGANESHSIVALTSVHGKEITVQAVPWADVTGLYMTDRPGNGGSGSAAFLGDGENEFTANTSNVPFLYVGKSSGKSMAAGSAQWQAATAMGYDAGPDASKWGVPISHLRK